MASSFDPYEHDRPPRSDGYEEETEKIIGYLRERGDQRIGQYLINAVRTTSVYDRIANSPSYNHNEAVDQALWSIEAPELLEAIQKLEEMKSK